MSTPPPSTATPSQPGGWPLQEHGLTRVRWGVQHGMLDPTARYVASAPPVPVSTGLAD
ncbi:hypothetical protein [Ornithinimicrobium cerasi]|uniref:hypothetical protein n=1 Tax=Ornithinimicrobium cerasi TaxID=2248773 RepID=UPI001379B848|nr:hypothetical protein [Ornithinimicrobium cerasi]